MWLKPRKYDLSLDVFIMEFNEKQLFVCKSTHLPIQSRAISHFSITHTGYVSGYCHLGRLLGAATILEHCLLQEKICYYPKQRRKEHLLYY